jgi:hypothetical protein
MGIFNDRYGDSILSDPMAYSSIDLLPREICGVPVDPATKEITVTYDGPRDMSTIKCLDSYGEVLQTINVTGGMSVDHSYGTPPVVTAMHPSKVVSSGTHIPPARARGGVVPGARVFPKYRSPVAPVLTPQEVAVTKYYKDNFIIFAHFDPKRDCLNHIILIQENAMTEDQLQSISGVFYDQDYKRYAPRTGMAGTPHLMDNVDVYHHILQGYTKTDLIMKGDLDDFLSSLGL